MSISLNSKRAYLYLTVAVTIVLFVLAITISNSDRKKTAIETADVIWDKLEKDIVAIGTVKPYLLKILSSNNSGIIEDIYVSHGDAVVSGQNLIKIDSTLAYEQFLLTKQRVVETQIQLQNMQSEYARLQRLRELQKVTAEQLADLVKRKNSLAELVQLTEELSKIHQVRVARRLIKAPYDGIVLFHSELDRGKFIASGTPLCSIVRADSALVESQLNQDDAVNITPGCQATIEEMNDNSRVFSGRITFIAPEIKKGVVQIHMQVDRKAALRLGSSVRITLPATSPQETILVPIQAVRLEDQNSFVYEAQQEKFRKHKVTLGKSNNHFVEIVQPTGLSRSSSVITAGFEQIADNDIITSDDVYTGNSKTTADND
jgi:RND family efflux transporter MFP subunit